MNLTPRQREVFEFIQSYMERHGHSPSHKELMRHFRWKSFGTVQDVLNAIQRRGYLSRSPSMAHSVTLHAQPNALPILGRVAAGRPLESYRHEEQISVPSRMLRGSGDFFVLEVVGDSMRDEGILEGDYVVVRRQARADNGQIVVAFLDDGAVIKTFFKKKSSVELHSANPRYEPLIVRPPQELRIEGIYCGLMRISASSAL